MDSGELRGLARGSRNSTAALEPDVAAELERCERKIEESLDDAWHAMKEIFDHKLYKVAGFKTFEIYVEKRWGYSKTHAYRLIGHAKIVDQLKAEGASFLPAGEGVSRPLQKLERISRSEEDFQQRVSEAWQIAVDTAPKVQDVPQVTVQHVESAMQHFGIYRNAKSKADTTAADCRTVLTKFAQSDARKMAPEDFVKSHGLKGFPSTFPRDLQWLNRCAELLGINES